MLTPRSARRMPVAIAIDQLGHICSSRYRAAVRDTSPGAHRIQLAYKTYKPIAIAAADASESTKAVSEWAVLRKRWLSFLQMGGQPLPRLWTCETEHLQCSRGVE